MLADPALWQGLADIRFNDGLMSREDSFSSKCWVDTTIWVVSTGLLGFVTDRHLALASARAHGFAGAARLRHDLENMMR
jgi:hypothetical protein